MPVITKKELYDLLEARHQNQTYSRLANMPKPDSFKDIKKANKKNN